jgi:hypothetical protein
MVPATVGVDSLPGRFPDRLVSLRDNRESHSPNSGRDQIVVSAIERMVADGGELGERGKAIPHAER